MPPHQQRQIASAADPLQQLLGMVGELQQQLATLQRRSALFEAPALPLDAFLTLLRDEFKFDLPLRTANAMTRDGRIPIVPKLRTGDMVWVNLIRWRQMMQEPGNYFRLVQENASRRVASTPARKAATRTTA